MRMRVHGSEALYNLTSLPRRWGATTPVLVAVVRNTRIAAEGVTNNMSPRELYAECITVLDESPFVPFPNYVRLPVAFLPVPNTKVSFSPSCSASSGGAYR